MRKINTLKSYKSKSLNGIINVPGDKSISHRSIIMGSLCHGLVKIFGILESTDVLNTIKTLRLLGVKITKKKTHFEVFGNGGKFKPSVRSLDFGNSGTGVRLMIGMLSSRNIDATFVGDKSLSKRPMSRITNPLKKFGANLSDKNGFLPVKLKKSQSLTPNSVDIKIGSAQIKSALILASLNLNGKSVINELVPSRDHSEILLKYLGASIEIKKKSNKNKIIISGPTILKARDIYIPGDISSAAFIIVATLLCDDSSVQIKSVGINFLRSGILDVLRKMNGKIKILKQWIINGEKIADIEVMSSELQGCIVDSKISTRLIDEYPILFVAASFANGCSTFTNLEELKFKESDRLKVMAEALKSCGVKLELSENSIKIFGERKNKGGIKVNTHNDHRIAMSMLVFGLISDKPIQVDQIKMIETSFPGFYELFKKIGSKIKYV